MTDRALAVVRAGALTTVQDRGRPGHAHLGVPHSGALDAPAAALVNRLVGNPPGAAVLETTLTGCALRARCALTVAVGGAPCPVTVDGRPVSWGAPVAVPPGALLDAGAADRGVRSYVAVRGGVLVEPRASCRGAPARGPAVRVPRAVAAPSRKQAEAAPLGGMAGSNMGNSLTSSVDATGEHALPGRAPTRRSARRLLLAEDHVPLPLVGGPCGPCHGPRGAATPAQPSRP
ncbi:hypothetical protein SVIOM342S_02463 [Streptomyces violaceorubidus]